MEETLDRLFKNARWVMDQYEVDGRMSAITDEELEAQIRLHLPEYYEQRKGSFVAA